MVTRAQQRRAQSQSGTQEDAIEAPEETSENVEKSQKEDWGNASKIREDITGRQDDHWTVPPWSAMESNDVGREFPFEDELFGEQGKTRV